MTSKAVSAAKSSKWCSPKRFRINIPKTKSSNSTSTKSITATSPTASKLPRTHTSKPPLPSSPCHKQRCWPGCHNSPLHMIHIYMQSTIPLRELPSMRAGAVLITTWARRRVRPNGVRLLCCAKWSTTGISPKQRQSQLLLKIYVSPASKFPLTRRISSSTCAACSKNNTDRSSQR